ncbi:hypothetical protein HK099_003726 [Clydaea vesicula]|uniref:ABC transporter domain-containing protein n=1 Tax=Clydaea vesicula TaxID=447962 RepID=A0AAD5U1G1_9FUNG|nr:hypothetical protein HK099_003726 [Clydaea vesicula]
MISSLLGTWVSGLIQSTISVHEVISCSNQDAMNPETNFYLRNLTYDAKIPKIFDEKTGIVRKAVNFFFYIVVDVTSTTPPGAAGFNFRHPCVFWFGENYPHSSIYERKPRLLSSFADQDSTYTAQPKFGWFQTLQMSNSTDLARAFNQLQTRPWSLYSHSPEVLSADIGERPQLPLVPINKLLSISANQFNPANKSLGIFDTFTTKYWLDVDVNAETGNFTIHGFQPVPFYQKENENLDDILAKKINEAVVEVTKIDKSLLLDTEVTNFEIANFFAKVNKVMNKMPYGAIHFDKIDHVAKKYKLTLQYGHDSRIDASSGFPSMGLRQLIEQTQLDNSFLRFSNFSSNLTKATITQGFRVFPERSSTKLQFPVAALIGRILFPFGVSFLLPIFVVTLVKEKEEKILVMMKMNGSGYFFDIELFTRTEPTVLLLVFFVWGHAQNSLVFFFSSMYNRSRFALVSVFLLILCGVIISLTTERLFNGKTIPTAYYLCRALGVMNEDAYVSSRTPYNLSRIVPGNEVFTILIYLSVESVFFFLASLYLSSVLPSEFGVQKPWYFPFQYLTGRSRSRTRKTANLEKGAILNESELNFEDQDVKDERARVLKGDITTNCPLIMKNMRKVYASRGGMGPKVAVKNVTLAVDEGVIFGLLGPNGAGKTTLISMLTGLYQQTSGEAILAGFDIKTETDLVYQKIGICPQFDILWDDLTLGEHLYFYARLKGVEISKEKDAVMKCLEQVSLVPFKDRLTKGLSGGEKRRLSIAISLVGSPSVVFLDEPTTGLDPEVRRLIWNIINGAREGKTVILTTHSMEEAEALCQRIGIMAKGSLRCLGNTLRLKELYGSGFKLFFNSKAEDTERASQFTQSLLPNGWKKMDAFTTNSSYEFPACKGSISKLFKEIEFGKKENGILDFGISQTTLEEVFLKIISESDAQAD